MKRNFYCPLNLFIFQISDLFYSPTDDGLSTNQKHVWQSKSIVVFI